MWYCTRSCYGSRGGAGHVWEEGCLGWNLRKVLVPLFCREIRKLRDAEDYNDRTLLKNILK